MAGTFDAYTDEDLSFDGNLTGRLAGTVFAAKDLYDVVGHVSICGNPDWGRTHGPALQTAAAIQALLDAGANLRGKTVTDEFAFSIVGENHHHGTPVNSNAPGRVCGGSSSGSAAVVAGGLVDFALGTDTGGSVRVPASFCGIFGLRPTHGRVSLSGVFPLAPSLDTAGWFARDPALMGKIGETLLNGYTSSSQGPSRLLFPVDAWQLATTEAQSALREAFTGLEDRFGGAEQITLSNGDGLSEWFDTFRIVQGAEIWETLGPWIEEVGPDIGPGIKERLEWCASITVEERTMAENRRNEITRRILGITADGAVLAMPVAPGAALQAGQAAVMSNEVRAKIISLSGIAPLTGVPQISLPLAKTEGCPIALSLMAAPDADELLLQMAVDCCGAADGGIAPLQASN